MNKELEIIPEATELSVFNAESFAAMVNVANMMCQTSLIPDCLVKDKQREFTLEKKAANCLMIVEQAARWGMSPFAVAQHASVVKGKLMWEGKLVAAVIAEKLGINLKYAYEGEGVNMTVTVSGTLAGEEEPRTIQGSVKGWKTDQWKFTDYEQRMAYRGAREWGRRHSPSVMLGIYTDDEQLPPKETRNVTPRGEVLTITPKPINPFETQEESEDIKPEANPTKTIPAEGRQKKDRLSKQATLKGVAKKTSASGKGFYVVTLDNGMKTSDLTTYSETLGEKLLGLLEGTTLNIVYTIPEKGNIALESAEVADKQEGGLI